MAKAKAKGKKKFKSRVKKNVPNGLCHVQATFNNTIVTFSDVEGNTLSWSSAGSLGFRGSQKGTARGERTREGTRRRSRVRDSRLGDGRHSSPAH
jgi:small subunit ribosomal protein S11